MKYYIIAGEASGDLHGGNLVRELLKNDPQAEVRCWGGDRMQAAGGELVKHYRDLAFMGFAEVLLNLRTILRNLKFCKEDILQYRPDALVLIDYPGFNLRIAEWAHRQGLKVIYYISPQVWAWKENRVKKMKKCIDKMLVILPFEKAYFKNKWDWEVEYVGHPLVDVIDRFKREAAAGPGAMGKQIALLPGSRKQEILKKLPVMLEVTRSYPDYRFVVAKAPGVDESFYDEMLKPYANVSWVANRTYELLSQAEAALVTSGTATLETALFGVPEVVCYKGSWLSYQIGKRLVKVKYISLVNLIMDKAVVRELIQDDLNTASLRIALDELLNDEKKRAGMAADYRVLKDMLQAEGDASARAAVLITRFLSK
ncbi:MAG: lipid-A-disaccharide synthase [Chitinophagaceae bacterium]